MADYVATLQHKLKMLHEEREATLRDNAADRSNKSFEQNLFKQELLDAKKVQDNQLNVSRIEADMQKHKARWKLEDDFDKMKVARLNKEINSTKSDVNFIYESRERRRFEAERRRLAEKEALEKEADEWEKTKNNRIKLAAAAFAGLTQTIELNTRVFRAETSVRAAALNNDYLGMQVAEKNKEATIARGVGQIAGGAIGFAVGGPVGALVGSAIGGGLGSIFEAESARIERRQQEELGIKEKIKRMAQYGPAAGASVQMELGDFFRGMREAKLFASEAKEFAKQYNLVNDVRQNWLNEKNKVTWKENIDKMNAETVIDSMPGKTKKEKDFANFLYEAQSMGGLDPIIKEVASVMGREVSEAIRGIYMAQGLAGGLSPWLKKQTFESQAHGDEIFKGLRESIEKMSPKTKFVKPQMPEGQVPIQLMPEWN